MFNLGIAYGAKVGLKLRLTIFYSMRKGGIEKGEKKSINSILNILVRIYCIS